MTPWIKAGVTGGMLALCVSARASAGPLEDGAAAARNGDYATAALKWRPIAAAGDSEAQYNLGVLYDKGLGVPPDPVVATQWCRKAAKAGVVDAEVNLGIHYAEGLGVPQDKAKAAKLFRDAAQHGDAEAQVEAQVDLGLLEHDGQTSVRRPAEGAGDGGIAPNGRQSVAHGPPLAISASARWVQIGAFENVAAAERRWLSIRRRLPADSKGRSMRTEPVSHDRAALQRTLVGPFANSTDARAFCEKVVGIGNECLVR